MNVEDLRCFNPRTGKRDGDYCVWEGEGKCLKCQAADRFEEQCEALSRIDDELHGVDYELYVYLHDVISQAMAKSCGEDTGHEDCIAHVLKAELDKAKAVIADVKKLPDEWEVQTAKAQWPADVPNGSQCADDLRAILGDN